MSRLVIVVSSSGGSDTGDWNNLITNNNTTWETKINIGDDAIIIFNGCTYYNQGWLFDTLTQKINNFITELNNNCAITILLHTQREEHLCQLKAKLSLHTNIKFEKFTTAIGASGDIYPNYVKPLCGANGNLSDFFDKLWQKLQKISPDELSKKSHSLRAQVLNLLIPFHLAYQDDTNFNQWEPMLVNCRKDIDDRLLQNLNDLFNITGCDNNITKNKILLNMNKTIELITTIINTKDNDNIGKELVKLINEIAVELDKLICYAEFGDMAL